MPGLQHALRRPLRAAILGLAALALTGCAGGSFGFRGSPEYDGAWVGQFSVSMRTTECRLTRGGLRVRIDQGTLDGKLRQSDGMRRFSGVVVADGTLEDTYIRGQYDVEDAQLTGRFDAEAGTAEGDWQSERCHGRWELRRIRR